MKKHRKKDEFLEQLRKVPIVQVAAEKSDLSRNTVYRWRKEDEAFKQAMDEALAEGEGLVNDMSESQLLSLIKEKNWSAISFWLRHHHNSYKNRLEVTAVLPKEELTPEQEELVREALRLSATNQYQLNQEENESNPSDNPTTDGVDDQEPDSSDRDN